MHHLTALSCSAIGARDLRPPRDMSVLWRCSESMSGALVCDVLDIPASLPPG